MSNMDFKKCSSCIWKAFKAYTKDVQLLSQNVKCVFEKKVHLVFFKND